MESLKRIFDFPWYIYFITILVLFFLFSKTKEWSYKAILRSNDEDDKKGDIVIIKYKAQEPSAEVHLNLPDSSIEGDIRVELNDELVSLLRVSKEGRYAERIYPSRSSSEKYRLKRGLKMKRLKFSFSKEFKPSNEDSVKVIINGRVVEGTLLKI